MNRFKDDDFKGISGLKSRHFKTSDEEDVILHISNEDLNSVEPLDFKQKLKLSKEKINKPPPTLPKRTGLKDLSTIEVSSELLSSSGRESLESIEESRIGAKDNFLRSDLTSGLKKYDYLNSKEKTELEKPESFSSTNVLTSNGDGYGIDKNMKIKDKDAYIGFANLPNQVYRKSVKKGFDFTLMVVGCSGLGKSTLLNSMFLSDIYNDDYPGPSLRVGKTLKVEKTSILLKEGGVQLRLNIVDTPGFGDSVDNSNCWHPIIEFIDKQYELYLNAESRVSRKSIMDTRVHCCLYFIAPSGHGLKALDIEFMKHLHDKVNIIPLIAKADSLTIEECRDFKKTILNEIIQNKINIYEFPDCEDDDEFHQQQKIKDRVPFAVVGSNVVVDRDGKKVRARVYPWGTVEVENLQHNDFLALRNMLIRTHLHDLKEVSNNVHYENFRYSKLLTAVSGESPRQKFATNKSPLVQMEEERKEHESKLKKMELEMEQVFENKVQEKMTKLTESQQDLQRRADQMKRSLEQQEQELEQRKSAFAHERELWEEQQKILDADQTNTLRKKKKVPTATLR